MTLLTTREFAVLRLGVTLTLEGVASELGVTRNTVTNHVAAAYAKLDVASRSEAVAYLDDHAPGWRPPRPLHEGTNNIGAFPAPAEPERVVPPHQVRLPAMTARPGPN